MSHIFMTNLNQTLTFKSKYFKSAVILLWNKKTKFVKYVAGTSVTIHKGVWRMDVRIERVHSKRPTLNAHRVNLPEVMGL